MSGGDTLMRLLRLAAPLKWRMLLAALLGFLTVGSSVALMATSAYLISAAALHPSVAALSVAIVGVRFFGISRGVFRYLERYVSHRVAFGLLQRLRVWFYRSVEPLAPARLLAYRGGDLLNRVVADIETLQEFYVRVVAPPAVAALTALALWFLLGAFDPAFALAFLGFYVLVAAGVPLLSATLGRGLGAKAIETRAELNAVMVDGVQGMADLVAFGQEARQMERVATLNRRLIALQQRAVWVSGLQSALGMALTNLCMWALLLMGIAAVRGGRLDGVYLATVLMAAAASFEAALALPTAAQQLGSSLEAARRLFAVVDARPEVEDPAAPLPVPTEFGISVRGLTFRYGEREPLALSDVCFDLPQGGCMALVGPSGAGKSTVANLFLRFWEYGSDSHILLGGRELRDYAGEDVRRATSVVAQGTHLFNTTIRENLVIARPGASEEEIIEAVRRAGAYGFVTSLPKGLDTQVGEGGLLLSGGERQRLAIARAFLRDAPILILDEPSANLDALVEREIMTSLRALAAGRTTLIITHRLVGLEMADEIVVLREGRVAERGTQQELLQREGLFREMWEMQRRVLGGGQVPEAED